MQLKIVAFPCILLMVCSCGSVNPLKIKYDDEKTQYTYRHSHQDISLRNQNNQLIDSSNIENFKTEIELNRNNYSFDNRLENELLLRNSDFSIARLYSDINARIKDKNYLQAQSKLTQIRQVYPDIDLYSDTYFLEGYIWEKLGQADLAADAYQKFYTYSSQKYSGKFRGHKHTDTNDSMYIVERNYANNYIQQKPDSINEAILLPIQPKFHYTSFQPGFIHNPDEFNKKSNLLTNLSLGVTSDNKFAYGLMFTSCSENSPINVRLGGVKSKNMTELFFALPIQVIKTASNNFGLKISPYLFCSTVKFDVSYNEVNRAEILFNAGLKASATYFLTQKFFLGTYYQWNQYNENNPYYLNIHDAKVWYPNEFDFSAYYNLFKNVNLKVGFKNKNIVAGFYLGNTELTYNISTSNLIWRTELF